MGYRWLFSAWIASLGADRIDLLGGRGPAVLLPMYVLTAIVVPVTWWPLLVRRRLPLLAPSVPAFLALYLAFAGLVTLSVLRSPDITLSAGRLVLLLGTSLGGLLVAVGVAAREDRWALLAHGARTGLLVALGFNLLQLANLIGVVPNDVVIGPALLKLEVMRYALIPRFAGAAYDMNRGAIIALLFAVLVRRGGDAVGGGRAWSILGLVLATLSLSRSAAVAAVPLLAFGVPVRRMPSLSRRFGIALVGLTLLVGGLVSLARRDPDRRAMVTDVGQLLALRLSREEGSAQVHGELVDRAFTVVTRAPTTLLGGIGYGMSHVVTGDIFPSDKYGNLHSLWLMILVEVGLPAMMLLGTLVLVPVVRGPEWRGLLLGLATFNLFYIFFIDPLYWMIVAGAWTWSQRPEGTLSDAMALPRGTA